MKSALQPVIMAGGSGTRLWPLSRTQYPKQFLALVENSETMLQATCKRLHGLTTSRPLIICNEEHRFLAAEQMRTIGEKNSKLILEPAGKNTAPAIALAALYASEHNDMKDEDTILIVLAADHVIKDVPAFQDCIRKAVILAEQGKLVACGIVPTRAETGYGYIQINNLIDNAYTISKFIEKPDSINAQNYLNSGNFLWNSGIFVFKAKIYLNNLKKWAPDILISCQAAMNTATEDMDFIRIGNEFLACRSESIDYAVMEKTTEAMVIPMNVGWSDVGSWEALWDIQKKDSLGNVCQGDVVAYDTNNSYIHAGHRLIATAGVSDLIIVETKDAVLVTHKNQVQSVKKLVEELKLKNRKEQNSHHQVHRPWGFYDSIDQGKRYQVKRITVNPKEKLSLQMHHHRAEHWIVVSGTAKITNGEKEYLLTENESTYIPIGQIHSLENPGKIPLELIEVQSGGYLGEDDIKRFEDKYNRY